jgi:quaternary ammonium compound-resistance protein SugE
VPWIWLAIAGVLEVVWVVLLKRADGFTRLGFGVGCVVAMGASVWCMSQALRTLPMGTVYAVWTGIGAAGALAWGIAMEGEPLTGLRIACVSLILCGVAGLKIGS